MLDEQIAKLYKLMFSPIITPYNLMENAKLENYDYVNYAKYGDGLVVTMQCLIEKGHSAIFSYYFDKNDHLFLVTMESSEGKEIIFDRESEVQTARDRIKADRQMMVNQYAV